MKSVKLEISATIANVGPGFDVLGLAFSALSNRYELALCEKPSRVLSVSGVDSNRVSCVPERNLTLRAAHRFAERVGLSEVYFSVKQDQELPVGGGLGSSAATALAGVYGASLLLDKKAPILEIAAEFEGHFDNLAPAYHGGMTIVGPHGVMKVPLGAALWLVVKVPVMRLETRRARAVLPKVLPQTDWVRQMSLACALVCACQQGDLDGISRALQDPYAEPRRAHLIPGFYEFKQSALKVGALGCSISGAGPSLFAVFGQESQAKDFAQVHGAYVGQVAEQGVRVC